MALLQGFASVNERQQAVELQTQEAKELRVIQAWEGSLALVAAQRDEEAEVRAGPGERARPPPSPPAAGRPPPWPAAVARRCTAAARLLQITTPCTVQLCRPRCARCWQSRWSRSPPPTSCSASSFWPCARWPSCWRGAPAARPQRWPPTAPPPRWMAATPRYGTGWARWCAGLLHSTAATLCLGALQLLRFCGLHLMPAACACQRPTCTSILHSCP